MQEANTIHLIPNAVKQVGRHCKARNYTVLSIRSVFTKKLQFRFAQSDSLNKRRCAIRRYAWAIALLVLLSVECVYADSVQANIPFVLNVGGDNLLATTFFGAGVSFTEFGGDAACNWCRTGAALSPGLSLTPSLQLFFGGFAQGTVTIDGKVQTVVSCCDIATITPLGSFTFPKSSNGTFTVILPATISPISGIATLDGGVQNFSFQPPPGNLILNFDFFPGNGDFPASYQFSHGVFTTVPEPGTLALTASGLAGILGSVYRKRKR